MFLQWLGRVAHSAAISSGKQPMNTCIIKERTLSWMYLGHGTALSYKYKKVLIIYVYTIVCSHDGVPGCHTFPTSFQELCQCTHLHAI